MRIEHYEFGCIRIDAHEERADLMLTPTGVQPRWWRKEGHVLALEDLDAVLAGRPRRLVVGTGAAGRMRPDPGLESTLRERSIVMETMPTPDAVARINELLDVGEVDWTTQPSLVAAMIEALELQGDEVVLEVGSGHGYQTALLATLARFVWSVEWWADLAERARENLEAVGIGNVEVVADDGSRGLAAHAPFDAVLVSAAFPTVAPPLIEQLTAGGRLVQPIGRGGDEEVMLFEKQGGALRPVRPLTLARFVRLVGAYGFPPD